MDLHTYTGLAGDQDLVAVCKDLQESTFSYTVGFHQGRSCFKVSTPRYNTKSNLAPNNLYLCWNIILFQHFINNEHFKQTLQYGILHIQRYSRNASPKTRSSIHWSLEAFVYLPTKGPYISPWKFATEITYANQSMRII